MWSFHKSSWENHVLSKKLGLRYPAYLTFPQTSDLSRALEGNRIVDHSDVVGASPVGAAPTTSSFWTYQLASTYCSKTTARREEKRLIPLIWKAYIRCLTVICIVVCAKTRWNNIDCHITYYLSIYFRHAYHLDICTGYLLISSWTYLTISFNAVFLRKLTSNLVGTISTVNDYPLSLTVASLSVCDLQEMINIVNQLQTYYFSCVTLSIIHTHI